MIEIISKEAQDKSGLSFDNAISYASATGLVSLGMLVAHNATRLMNKQNSLIANFGVFGVGLVGAMFIKHPLVKLGMIGMCAFGGVKTIGLLTNVATTPGATNGLGFIPDSVKTKIRQFVPTLGAVDVPFEMISGAPEPSRVELDEPIQGLYDEPKEESVNGLGATSSNLV